jgi:hypothetical protein
LKAIPKTKEKLLTSGMGEKMTRLSQLLGIEKLKFIKMKELPKLFKVWVKMMAKQMIMKIKPSLGLHQNL